MNSQADKCETEKLDRETDEFELQEIKSSLKQSSPINPAIKNPAPLDVGAFQRGILDKNSLLLEFRSAKTKVICG